MILEADPPERGELEDARIQELADEYIARDLGEDAADFLAWARDRGAR